MEVARVATTLAVVVVDRIERQAENDNRKDRHAVVD